MPSIQSAAQRRRKKIGGGEEQKEWDSPRGYILQGFQCFLPPIVWAFVSLLVANAKSSVCVFVPSERGESLENL